MKTRSMKSIEMIVNEVQKYPEMGIDIYRISGAIYFPRHLCKDKIPEEEFWSPILRNLNINTSPTVYCKSDLTKLVYPKDFIKLVWYGEERSPVDFCADHLGINVWNHDNNEYKEVYYG